MAAAPLIWLMAVGLFGSASSEGPQIEELSADPGDTVSLPCDATMFKPIYVVEWSRTDQNQTNDFFLLNGESGLKIKDKSYEGRVNVKDKDKGDLTLTLKNVTTKDSGTYECHIQRKTNRRKRAVIENKHIQTIYLSVKPGPQGGGHQVGGHQDGGHQDGGHQQGQTGLLVALGVLAVVVVVVVSLLVKKRLSLQSRPAPEEPEEPPLI